MKIEIFVVLTELQKSGDLKLYSELIEIQNEITKEFGGLSVIPNVRGLWFNNTGGIEEDKVEIWLIYTGNEELDRKKAFQNEILEKTTAFAKRIKKITAQKSQAFGINVILHFI